MKITNRKQAELVKAECIKISAEQLQAEFELEFEGNLDEAYSKIQSVTDALGEDLLTTTLLQENRLYLYEILLDNSVEEIVADIRGLVEKP